MSELQAVSSSYKGKALWQLSALQGAGKRAGELHTVRPERILIFSCTVKFDHHFK
jgi:hypothetical protein